MPPIVVSPLVRLALVPVGSAWLGQLTTSPEPILNKGCSGSGGG